MTLFKSAIQTQHKYVYTAECSDKNKTAFGIAPEGSIIKNVSRFRLDLAYALFNLRRS
jgi:hypothetical protein